MNKKPFVNISKDQFNRYKQDDIPFAFIKEFPADLITPTSIFLNLKDKNYPFMLESSTDGNTRGRYTFIGAQPNKMIKSTPEEIEIVNLDLNESKHIQGDLFKVLEEETFLPNYQSNSQIPFTGGSVGYIGYDCVRYMFQTNLNNPSEIDIPESFLLYYPILIAYDHSKSVVSLILQIRKNDDFSYESAIQALDDYFDIIKQAVEIDLALFDTEPTSFTPKEGQKDEYTYGIKRIQEEIALDKAEQIVISNRFSHKTQKTPFDIYRQLRHNNPSPYLFYIDYHDFQVIGSSPETLVKVNNKTITTFPIAGTRPRGKTIEEDKQLEQDLLQDKKEVSEHLMLVELSKKDLATVCDPTTINLTRFKEIEHYSHVMHIVSEVTGTLSDDKGMFDAFKSCFPAGTVSGSPRPLAIQLIEELEPVKRELYSGGLGYFGYNGNLDSCIAIRTIILKNNIAYIQAGAGIVADSEPEYEFQETLNKAMALLEIV